MSHVRFIWPSITPCPKCANTSWWAVKTQGPANMRKCRGCGEWFRVEATHEEVMNADGKGSSIRPVGAVKAPLVKSKA